MMNSPEAQTDNRSSDDDAKLSIENGMLSVIGVLCASIILLVATIYSTSEEMTSSMKGYSNAVSAITIILSSLMILKVKQIDVYSLYIRKFLFLWTFIGACILTFRIGPFSKTGNGFFCSWAMAIFSFFSTGVKYTTVKTAVVNNVTPLTGLGYSSIIVLLASMPYIDTEYHYEAIFALIISILSIIVVVFLIQKAQQQSKLPRDSFSVLFILSFVWIFTAGVTTFRGPFLVTGNGYFASWAGAILSVVATKEVFSDDKEIEEPPQPKLKSPEEGSGPV